MAQLHEVPGSLSQDLEPGEKVKFSKRVGTFLKEVVHEVVSGGATLHDHVPNYNDPTNPNNYLNRHAGFPEHVVIIEEEPIVEK